MVGCLLVCCMGAPLHPAWGWHLPAHLPLGLMAAALLPSARRPPDRADALTDPNARLGRTISYLNLIDLAGSESAKVRC